MEMNEVLDRLPRHLMDLVIDQPYNEYTAQDHAVWRFVMRQNVDFLQHVAHGSYLDGLRKTGISIDSVPHMYGMNRILKEIGWAAVAVDGFIPPAAFMEFQAYNVLVIAADIRPIDQIEYTPAPDIIHEAAGHAPIIAHEDYADYLREFGRIGAKAFSSAMDYKQYEAIRHLSILKADPYTPKADIEKAEKRIEDIENNMGKPSEMSRIRNLHWWTVEFGLVGELKKPKIYGAGLLSSIGESYNCLQDHVKKIPYTVDAANFSFDITSQQPHLFVTPSFEHLNDVLQEFADGMALRTGGLNAIHQAIRSENTGTLEWNSGLQVSGTFSRVIAEDEQPVYLESGSPASLAYNDTELEGYGKNNVEKFGSPVGRPKGLTMSPIHMSDKELFNSGMVEDEELYLEYVSGISIKGTLRKIVRKEGKNLMLVVSNALVKYNDEVLHRPEDGLYYLAIGEEIVSGYSGPADANAWGLSFNPPEEKTHKIEHNEISKSLHKLYQQVREIREKQSGFEAVPQIWNQLKQDYPNEWLLAIELLELARQENMTIEQEIVEFLEKIQNRIPEFTTRINNGLKLVGSNITNKSIGVEEV
ncbi:MAG TPA: aromatic amino acid hydroxylase [Bacteroidales bacterium]|nr:aromatic amino acid hydroxylase [Bacteroidales bacterium]